MSVHLIDERGSVCTVVVSCRPFYLVNEIFSDYPSRFHTWRRNCFIFRSTAFLVGSPQLTSLVFCFVFRCLTFAFFSAMSLSSYIDIHLLIYNVLVYLLPFLIFPLHFVLSSVNDLLGMTPVFICLPYCNNRKRKIQLTL